MHAVFRCAKHVEESSTIASLPFSNNQTQASKKVGELSLQAYISPNLPKCSHNETSDRFLLILPKGGVDLVDIGNCGDLKIVQCGELLYTQIHEFTWMTYCPPFPSPLFHTGHGSSGGWPCHCPRVCCFEVITEERRT